MGFTQLTLIKFLCKCGYQPFSSSLSPNCGCRIRGRKRSHVKEVLNMTQMGLNYLIHKEAQRQNVASLAESKRHNLANEVIQKGTLDETSRSNLANESIRAGTLGENIRSNKMNESIKWSTLGETVRANQANELIRQTTNAINASGIEENKRHNLESELLNEWSTNLDNLTKASPLVGADTALYAMRDGYRNTYVDVVPQNFMSWFDVALSKWAKLMSN